MRKNILHSILLAHNYLLIYYSKSYYIIFYKFKCIGILSLNKQKLGRTKLELNLFHVLSINVFVLFTQLPEYLLMDK